jgi:hypothetical protein
MSTNNFFPRTEDAQIVWLSHYLLKLPVNGPTCGISAEEITHTEQDIAYWTWLLQYWHPAKQRDAKEATAHKQLMVAGIGNSSLSQPVPSQFPNPPPAPEPGMQKRLSSQIIRIKASLNYTDVIGHDLGIIAATNTVQHLIPEPTVSVELGENGNRVRIDFNKYGHDGVWIECRINNGDWVFVAIDTVKPYYDERPLATGNTHETRDYRMRWWDKSVAHGEWSAVQQVVIGLV